LVLVAQDNTLSLAIAKTAHYPAVKFDPGVTTAVVPLPIPPLPLLAVVIATIPHHTYLAQGTKK
jgi:hypothetical protein